MAGANRAVGFEAEVNPGQTPNRNVYQGMVEGLLKELETMNASNGNQGEMAGNAPQSGDAPSDQVKMRIKEVSILVGYFLFIQK